MTILVWFLAGGVVVLASSCVHLIHRQHDLRQLLNILTQRAMSDIAKKLIELDNKHSNHWT
jgi:hypothetical protein